METKKAFDRDWQYLETENFIRYVRPLGRKIEKDDLKKEEKHLKDFSKLFKIKIPNQIKIFSVGDKKEMKEVIGRESNGCANPKEWAVFSTFVYHPHEVTHVLAYNLLGDPNNLLREGLAVLFGWDGGLWHKKPVDYWMKEFITSGKIIPLKDLVDDLKFRSFEERITYAIGAAFVNFLIKKFGMKKFKTIYSKVGRKKPVSETIKLFEKELKIKFDDLEKDFIKFYS